MKTELIEKIKNIETIKKRDILNSIALNENFNQFIRASDLSFLEKNNCENNKNNIESKIRINKNEISARLNLPVKNKKQTDDFIEIFGINYFLTTGSIKLNTKHKILKHKSKTILYY
jgi:hypothetical protein